MKQQELITVAERYIQDLLAGKGAKRPGTHLFESMLRPLAIGCHNTWCDKKRANGYVYGETVDDVAKTTNLLVEFDTLPEDIKEANIRNAKKTLTLIFGAGFEIRKVVTAEERKALIDSMAEALHDEWALGKALKGYTYAEERNDNPEKGQLTHRNMLPFKVLLERYPDDAAYDVDTATGIVDTLENSGFRICFPDVAPVAAATC